MPVLYDLFWDSGLPHARAARVARSKQGATVVMGERTPALILYPSFFTPAVFFPDDAELDGHFELLMATPGKELTAEMVNSHLVITRGLARHRQRPVDAQPLFDAAAGRIDVKPTTPDANGILATHTQFRGILHRTWRSHVNPVWPATMSYWKVRVHASACDRALRATASRSASGRNAKRRETPQDPQDAAIAQLFQLRNHANFADPTGFRIAGGDVLPESPDADRPVLAHHPLAVYPAGARALSRVLHVSDLHLNLRQDLIAQTDARVIEAPLSVLREASNGDEISPEIGSLVQRYSRNVLSILDTAARGSAPDAICVGGDLVDHIRNATTRPGESIPESAAAVWERIGLEPASYATRYTAGPDFIAAFSIMQYICEKYSVPLFGVTGNHDAYVDGYGISPRVANTRVYRHLGNEGIAADHNLTFFEAILAFGPTYHAYDGYGDVRDTTATASANTANFHAEWFDWYHTVFTPFADFAVSMPAQRLVGLGWGEREHMVGAPPDGHGVGHLPRATGAVGQPQVALVRNGLSTKRRTLLMTHFTFASFKTSVSERESPPAGAANPAPGARRQGQLNLSGVFTDFDHGTFTGLRAEMYAAVTEDPAQMSAVLTGHSHRKALYLLPKGGGPGLASGTVPAGPRPAAGAPTTPSSGPIVTMVGLGDGPLQQAALAPLLRDAVPVVLSDSAGPIPRANRQDEFGLWGSDRAAGTLLEFDWQGQLQNISVVASTVSRRPRVAVALDYWHNVGDSYSARGVWDGPVMEFRPMRRPGGEPQAPSTFWMPLKERWEAIGLTVRDVVFVGRLDRGPGVATVPRWTSIRAQKNGPEFRDEMRRRTGSGASGLRTFPLWEVPLARQRDLQEWLEIANTSDRFLALRFEAKRAPWMQDRYDWDSWWTFEVEARQDTTAARYFQRWWVLTTKDAWSVPFMPGSGETSERPVSEQPNFAHRRTLDPKYTTVLSSNERRAR